MQLLLPAKDNILVGSSYVLVMTPTIPLTDLADRENTMTPTIDFNY
jgi:hypothetical protein